MAQELGPMEVGKRLRKLRGVRTKTGVAKELGISYSTLCKYEYGIRTPQGNMRQRIADYYGVTEHEIFYAVDNDETR